MLKYMQLKTTHFIFYQASGAIRIPLRCMLMPLADTRSSMLREKI
jgi:hypothetical protein